MDRGLHAFRKGKPSTESEVRSHGLSVEDEVVKDLHGMLRGLSGVLEVYSGLDVLK